MGSSNKKHHTLLDFPAAWQALKRLYAERYTPVLAATAFLIIWIASVIYRKIRAPQKQKPFPINFLHYCFVMYLLYSLLLCWVNDDVIFQLDGISLLFLQLHKHFHIAEEQKTFVLSDPVAMRVARKLFVLSTIIFYIVLQRKKIRTVSDKEPMEEQTRKYYPRTYKYRHYFEPLLTFKCDRCQLKRVAFASHGDFLDVCMFDYHHFCPFTACEVCGDTLFAFTCLVISLTTYSALDIAKNIQLFILFKRHAETLSGAHIRSEILPCYMMQSSAGAVGNALMLFCSAIIVIASAVQVVMQIPNLFHVFSQADRISLKASEKLIAENKARLFINEYGYYTIATLDCSLEEERITLRDEHGHEFICLTAQESRDILRRAWKKCSWDRFREQIR